jgi:hypothetical protein
MKIPHSISISIVIGATVLGLAAAAQADCPSLGWRSGLELPIGFDTLPTGSASIDHDGDGVPSLFVAGSGAASGTSFTGLVQLVNGRWQQFGTSFTGTVAKLERFDLDGDGTPSFLVLGALRLEPSGPLYGMLEWNGASWVGRAVNQRFGDAVVIDADGDGIPSFIASQRNAPDAAQVILRWTPSGWVSLSPENAILPASPSTTSVVSLVAHDSDGNGRKELFATVSVSAGGSTIASGIARWDGFTWSSVGTGALPAVISQGVYSMCSADTDGDGAAELVVGGLLSSGATSGSQVVAFDGSSWNAVGGTFFRTQSPTNLAAAVQRVASVDLGDGAGPTLFATGFFDLVGGATVANLARWNGKAWVDAGGGFPGSNLGGYRGLFGHDLDADGAAELVCVGNFLRAGGTAVGRVAAYDGAAWSAVGLMAATRGLNAAASSAVLFDHDGDGRESLIVGGAFSQAGGVPAPGLAAFDGASWTAIANPWGAGVEALLVADLDGDGVKSLYAAGDTGLPYAPNWTARTIAVYNPSKGGGTWTQLGGSLNGYVTVLAAVDHDLNGQPSLFAGGDFTQIAGVANSRLAAWNGSGWTNFNPGQGQWVSSIVAFDDDGNGTPSMIVAMGNNSSYTFFQRVRKFNGTSWSNLGTITEGHVFRLQVFDHDGDGTPSLFSFGQMLVGSSVGWVQRLESGGWTSFGPVSSDGPYQAGGSLVRFDHDGDGVETLHLVNEDPFGGAKSSIRRFDSFGWETVASDLGGIYAPALVADLEQDGTRSLHVVGAIGARSNGPGSHIGIVDPCGGGCVGDIDGSGAVDAADLAALFAAWGPCSAGCGADLDQSGAVDAFDLATVLSAWGACP